jgi:hypothetical protein
VRRGGHGGEGLVTHLTSLILIDEAATQEASIPATRKVALPTPRTVGRQYVSQSNRAALGLSQGLQLGKGDHLNSGLLEADAVLF